MIISGFIPIDCGLPKGSSGYTEPISGINYISDEPFITTGVSKTLTPENQSGYRKQLAHLRAFPEGIRYCYIVNVTRGTNYLIRATLLWELWQQKFSSRIFYPPRSQFLGDNHFHIGCASGWGDHTCSFTVYICVCLVNNGTGTPFISALELRPLTNDSSLTHSGSLQLFQRSDLVTITNQTYRSGILYMHNISF